MRRTFVAVAWTLALYAVLRLESWLPHRHWGVICGPWGCGPPLVALIAWHGFWGLLPVAVVSMLGERIGPAAVRRWAQALIATGLGSLLAVSLWQLFAWWPHVESIGRRYVVQRCLFAWVTITEPPLAAALIAGAVLRWWSRTLGAQPAQKAAR